MRKVDSEIAKERKCKILNDVVYSFIATAKPVSSQTLADTSYLSLSPATIRNILAELEEEGYLTHPHTSAGRIPTDKGYRFYVDSLMDIRRLAQGEENRIKQEYQTKISELEDVFLTTTKMLSILSHYTGFMVAPSLEDTKLNRIELVYLSPGKIMLLIVSEAGLVSHRVVELNDAVEPDILRQATRVLNERLAGYTMSEARQKIMGELERAIELSRLHTVVIRQLCDAAFDTMAEAEVYVEGAENTLECPDLRDYDNVRALVHIMEEKETLRGIFDDLKRTSGIKVAIGRENNDPGLENFSFVSTTYKVGDKPVGALGIIGPKRMEYSHIIAIVDNVARALNSILNK